MVGLISCEDRPSVFLGCRADVLIQVCGASEMKSLLSLSSLLWPTPQPAVKLMRL